MGVADVATVLFTRFLKFDRLRPALARPRPLRALGRPRLHAALCPALSDRHEGMSLDEIKHFRQLGSRRPATPNTAITPGVETTTGPLGQGIATAVGMAIAERMLARRVRRRHRRPPHLCARLRRRPDGRRQPGGDRARRASRSLHRLIVLWDDNGITIDGPTSLVRQRRPGDALRGGRLGRARIDGHDPDGDRRARSKRRDVRQARPDRLQDDDRLRRSRPRPARPRRTAIRWAPRRSPAPRPR